METVAPEQKVLSAQDWIQLESAHRARVEPWVDAFRKRRERRLKHPVYDFLFEYYQCKRRLITDWHPILGIFLQGGAAKKFLKSPNYSTCDQGIFLNPESITANIVNRARWISRLIEAAKSRPNHIHCFGLHEWAMVYKSERLRHEDTPLRLAQEEIEGIVQTSTIRCTHYDAYRFFSKSAKPLNTLNPKPEGRRINEQFGCIHFNMDLFKWCYKLNPWVSSELMTECLMLAIDAREIDMRASPYDLSALGYQAITIETSEGRKQYQENQIRIADKGRVLANRLLAECRKIVTSRSTPDPKCH